jgi:hypothetical protein
MSVNGLLSAFAIRMEGGHTPQAGWRWCKQPKPRRKGRFRLDFGTFYQPHSSTQRETHNKAPPKKAKVDPTYIGSEKKLNGNPVTRDDMRIPK